MKGDLDWRTPCQCIVAAVPSASLVKSITTRSPLHTWTAGPGSWKLMLKKLRVTPSASTQLKSRHCSGLSCVQLLQALNNSWSQLRNEPLIFMTNYPPMTWKYFIMKWKRQTFTSFGLHSRLHNSPFTMPSKLMLSSGTTVSRKRLK